MKLRQVLLFAITVAVAGTLNAADPLIEYEGATNSGTTGANQYLAKVVVGTADVTIGSFGVYGQARVDGNVKWLIFDRAQPNPLVFLSEAQQVTGDPGLFANEAEWYDSPEMTFTLLANHTYAMGLIADRVGTNSFYWGSSLFSPDYNKYNPGPSTVTNGLTLPFMQMLSKSGLVNGVFATTPALWSAGMDDYRFKTSLRISAPEVPAIPEPESYAMLLAGLGLIGVVVGRRRNQDAI